MIFVKTALYIVAVHHPLVSGPTILIFSFQTSSPSPDASNAVYEKFAIFDQ